VVRGAPPQQPKSQQASAVGAARLLATTLPTISHRVNRAMTSISEKKEKRVIPLIKSTRGRPSITKLLCRAFGEK
jgi:hypothetical protein